MHALEITIAREVRHWRIEVQVQGDVETRTIFGCNDGILPILSGLYAAQAEVHAVSARAERQPGELPPTVTVRMPSGRLLTFLLSSVQEPLPHAPKPL